MMDLQRIDYPEDCQRIQRVLLEDLRAEATLGQCQKIWEARSNDWFASWLMLPESDIELAAVLSEWVNVGHKYEATEA